MRVAARAALRLGARLLGRPGRCVPEAIGELAPPGVVMAAVLATFAMAATVPAAAAPVVFALESEPERLDPLTIRNPQTFRVAWQIYEGLIGLSQNGEIEPRLAASWRTDDFRTWRFTLRPNAVFHASPLFGAGSPPRTVTADDVVWSYTAFCSPGAFASFVLVDLLEGCSAYNAGEAKTVAGVRALSPEEVEITLVTPEPFFLNRISTAWIAIFPREAAAPEFRDLWGLRHAVGTGPYRLVSRSDAEHVVEPNPDYWDEARIPRIERLIFRVVKNPQIRFAELAKGAIDISPVPAELFPALIGPDGRLRERYRGTLSLNTFETLNIHFIGIDLKAVPDIHLRRAMALGTDRPTMASLLLRGFARVIAGPVPTAMPGYAALDTAYRPEAARAALAKSDYVGGPIDMYVHDLGQSERIGQIFQQQMKKIGVDIRLVKRDYGSVIGQAIEGRAPLFQSYAEIVFSSPEPLLLNLFDSAKIPVPNFWKYANPQTDAALKGLRDIPSSEARLVEAARIEREIMRAVPGIFLYSAEHVLVHSRRVDDVTVNRHEHYRLELLRLAE